MFINCTAVQSKGRKIGLVHFKCLPQAVFFVNMLFGEWVASSYKVILVLVLMLVQFEISSSVYIFALCCLQGITCQQTFAGSFKSCQLTYWPLLLTFKNGPKHFKPFSKTVINSLFRAEKALNTKQGIITLNSTTLSSVNRLKFIQSE